jgi:NAD-dependent dihydropyrimidine dehydrogenase PreA subunit
MKRSIINIDKEKCNGCGLCIPNCHEGALQIIDDKATLVSELMCDGLGACIGHCPEGAITIEEREAEAYDEIMVIKRIIPEGKNVLIAHLSHLKEHNQFEFLKIAFDYLKDNQELLTFNLVEVIEKVNISGNKASAPKPEPVIAHAVKEHKHEPAMCGCPGSISKTIKPKETVEVPAQLYQNQQSSQLTNWPIQMHLVNPNAGYFKNADLLLAADCVSFALADFHQNYLSGKVLTIACPKLDANKEIYVEKLVAMINQAEINSITVMKMEVPCCSGLLQIADIAVKQSGKNLQIKSITVSLQGEILN